MIGDREFFAALDQTQPAMRPITQAAEQGDFARARQLFADHLRTREVRYGFDPRVVDRAVKHNREDADRVLAGQIRQVYYEHQFPGGEVDWVSNPTRDNPKQAYTGEWTWQLNRMYFWPNLARTYWATGDEKICPSLGAPVARLDRSGHAGFGRGARPNLAHHRGGLAHELLLARFVFSLCQFAFGERRSVGGLRQSFADARAAFKHQHSQHAQLGGDDDGRIV